MYKNFKDYVKATNAWLEAEPQSPTCMLGDSEVARVFSSGEVRIAGEVTLTVEEARLLAAFLIQMYGEEVNERAG